MYSVLALYIRCGRTELALYEAAYTVQNGGAYTVSTVSRFVSHEMSNFAITIFNNKRYRSN